MSESKAAKWWFIAGIAICLVNPFLGWIVLIPAVLIWMGQRRGH